MATATSTTAKSPPPTTILLLYALFVIACLCSIMESMVVSMQHWRFAARLLEIVSGEPRQRMGETLPSTRMEQLQQQQSNGDSSNTTIIRHAMGLKPLENRWGLGTLLTEMGLRSGVLVGAQRGLNAIRILEKWHTCDYLALVDAWQDEEEGKGGGGGEGKMEDNPPFDKLQQAKINLAPFQARTRVEFFPIKSVLEAVSRQWQDESFDFVHVQQTAQRHDFCSVMEDLVAYWPKLRQGGVMAGYDFEYAKEANASWSSRRSCNPRLVDNNNNNNTVQQHPGGVRGAVETFALGHGLTVSVMFQEESFFGWMMQKPWNW